MASSSRKLWLLSLLGLGSLSSASPTAFEGSSLALKDIQLPPGVPAKIEVTDKPNDPRGKMVKVRYGPFVLPPNSIFMALPEEAGGAKIHKPCDECWLGQFQGSLEYEDGREANVDTGLYLHHFVIVNNNQPDWLCGLRLGALFRPQYVYNSGNERPPVRLNNKYKFGMRVRKGDTFGAAGELMNMSNETKTVYATTTYEVIPIDTPGYREATHLRIDVWQCGASDVPALDGAYTYTSPKYVSPYQGLILHNDGHGHDGTTEVHLIINGKVFCNSIQYYGLRPGWKMPLDLAALHHGDDHKAEMQYISDAVACEDYGRVEKGDTLWTIAFYNETKYPQMEFKGHKENQMGISFLYIGRDEHTLNDKLTLEVRGDEWPAEMNITSSPFGGLGRLGGGNASQPLNLANMLQAFGIPKNASLSTLFPNLPKDFDINNPAVTEPFPPFRFTGYTRPGAANASANSGGILGGLLGGGLPGGGLLAGIPGLEGLALNISDPASVKKFDGIITAFVPGLPKGFSVGNILVPGGIVISEIETLIEGITKALGLPQGKGPFGFGGAQQGKAGSGKAGSGSPAGGHAAAGGHGAAPKGAAGGHGGHRRSIIRREIYNNLGLEWARDAVR